MKQSSSKKGVSPSSSGKKFIQARLPFKLVSTSPASRLTSSSSSSTTPLTEAAADVAAATNVTQQQQQKQSSICSPITLKLPGDTRKRKLSSSITKDDLEICPSAKINKVCEIICLDNDEESKQPSIKEKEKSKGPPTNKRCSTRQSKSSAISAVDITNESNKNTPSRTTRIARSATPPNDDTSSSTSFVIKLSSSRKSASKKSLKSKSLTTKSDRQTDTNIVEIIDSDDFATNLEEKLPDEVKIAHIDTNSSEMIVVDLIEEKQITENKCESMDVSLIEQNSFEPNETSESDEKNNTFSSKDSNIVKLDSDNDENDDNLNMPNKKAKIDDTCSTPSTTDSKTIKMKARSVKKELDRQKAKELREIKIQEEKEMRKREREERELLRKKEREDKENQKRREREEKEDQRRREREEKEDQKRKEREEKEEQRRQEKELRDQKRQAELDAKNEERRRQDEEKLAKEEAVIKKKQQEVEAFTKFFVQPTKDNVKKMDEQLTKDSIDIEKQQNNFMPFRVKGNMKLAPIVRRNLSLTQKKYLENIVFDCDTTNSTAELLTKKNQLKDQLYLGLLLGKKIKPECTTKTWPNEDNEVVCVVDDELEGAAAVIEEPSHNEKFRAKFYKFEENRRPPFYGTWRKQSKLIKPRKPFALDQKYFDYEIDSDDEWEGEEPGGESLHGSDDEKDKESDDDYDIDNEFFVPHGHLSDEELMDGDEIDDDDNSPAAQKAKLKIIQKEFADEMGKKTEKIKPRLIGLIWQDRSGDKPESCPNIIWELLKKRRMIFQGDCVQLKPLQQQQQIQSCTSNGVDSDGDDENVDINSKSSASTNTNQLQRIQQFTDAMTKDLIQLIHGNINNKGFLAQEFRAYLMKQQKTDDENYKIMSMNNIRGKMTKIAKYGAYPEEGEFYCKYFWYVLPDVQKEYGVNFGLPNGWSYILKKDTKEKKVPLPPIASGGDVTGVVDITLPAVSSISSNNSGVDNKQATAEESTKEEIKTAESINDEQNEQNSSNTKLLKSKPPSFMGNIAKFTKILNEDDKKKQFAAILNTDKMVNVLTSKRTGSNAGGGGGGDDGSSSRRNDADDVIIISDNIVKPTSSTKKKSNLINSQNTSPANASTSKRKMALISKFLQINNSKSTSSLMKQNTSSKDEHSSNDVVVKQDSSNVD